MIVPLWWVAVFTSITVGAAYGEEKPPVKDYDHRAGHQRDQLGQTSPPKHDDDGIRHSRAVGVLQSVPLLRERRAGIDPAGAMIL